MDSTGSRPAAALGGSGPAHSPRAASDPTSAASSDLAGSSPAGCADWEELAPGVLRCRLPGWDETVGAIAGRDAVLLVDAGATPSDGAALRRSAEQAFELPVRHLALTHPHFDHVLGTPGCAGGVRTVAAVGTGDHLVHGGRQALAEDAVRHGLDPATAHEAAAALRRPAQEVSGELVIGLGGRDVVLVNAGPGHTAHDLVVLVPDLPMVFCGDLVEESGPPQVGADAYLAQWPAALDRLLALGGEQARYVPGHGAVVDASFVRTQREALARLGG